MLPRIGRLALCVVLLSASGMAAPEDGLIRPDLSLIPPELSWLLRFAKQGDLDAQAALGYRFFMGIEVPQNSTEAAKWTYGAATRGLDWAQSNLGVMYEFGMGLRQDDVEAYAWFKTAAGQGYTGGTKGMKRIVERMTQEERDRAEHLAEQYRELFVLPFRD